ncbi:hypothetical protein Zm00014a_028914 [Zea mays]|uniref:Uncharacterized protein n=1 Tax=Zea mays TaxID=4577 RepID=A0A3L6DID9_MAIZE|nr:hypothetical protein Zm00014a_028914 [Zea mays]
MARHLPHVVLDSRPQPPGDAQLGRHCAPCTSIAPTSLALGQGHASFSLAIVSVRPDVELRSQPWPDPTPPFLFRALARRISTATSQLPPRLLSITPSLPVSCSAQDSPPQSSWTRNIFLRLLPRHFPMPNTCST